MRGAVLLPSKPNGDVGRSLACPRPHGLGLGPKGDPSKPNGVSRGTGAAHHEACLAIDAVRLFSSKPNGVSRGTGIAHHEACLAFDAVRSITA